MKTDYNFGDKVKVLPKREDSTEYRKGIVEGLMGFVISNDGSDKFPVEVEFFGFYKFNEFTELFNYDELEFLGNSDEKQLK